MYSLNEVDLEVMRGVAAAASHQITSLAQGHGPYYAHLVASLLGYQGKKVLLLDFEQKIERGKALDGLYEFTIGEVSELPIQHKEQYDELTFGKKSLVKNEFLRSKQFEKGLRLLQQRYDCILLVTGTPLRSDEVASCMEYSSTAIVSFRSESWEEVRNVRNLAKARDMKLFFIEY